MEEDKGIVLMKELSPDKKSDFQLVYKSHETHRSLVTLTFTAETVSFVDKMWVSLIILSQKHWFNFDRSNGRIVEAMIEDFGALAGSATLLVIVQNTGTVSADYLVRIA